MFTSTVLRAVFTRLCGLQNDLCCVEWDIKLSLNQSINDETVFTTVNKKHLKNVGPIRHCEPPHAALPFTRCRYCRTPPAHRCPQQRRRRRQRQRVTEGTAMAP